MDFSLQVREMTVADIDHIVGYWSGADAVFLERMGVDLAKLPSDQDLERMLRGQLRLPVEQRLSYALIWLIEGQPVGHCNVNKIRFGEEAFMHLHLWRQPLRKRGLGVRLVLLSLPYFFERLQLKVLYCEPYALNEAPNKTLERVGFHFEKEYNTVPGSINFEQPVKRWRLSLDHYHQRTDANEIA